MSGKALRWVGRAALAAVVLALVLAALVTFVVPGIVKSQAAKGMEAATGRKLAIGAVSINAFAWTVEIRDVSLSEVGGKGTFASFKSGKVAVSPASIWRGAPVISQVRLEAPHFNVIRTGPNTYNFSDLIKYLTMPVPAISLNDVAITAGSIDFTDRALTREERHTVRDAELVVPFLTTIPKLASEYGNPRFSAIIDGAPLVVEARVRGLPKAAEVSAQVNLTDLSLPVYLSYLPAKIPVRVDSGRVAVRGTASYRITPDAGGEIGWDGTVTVTEIKVSEHQGPLRVDIGQLLVRSRVMLGDKLGMRLEDGALEVRNVSVPFVERDGMSLGLLAVTGARFAEEENRLDVAGVLLDKGSIRLSRDRKGVFSPVALLEHLERQMPRGKRASRAPVPWRVGKLEGKGIRVAFTDGTRKELPSFSLTDVYFKAEDVTGPVFGPIPFSIGARWGKDATIQATGHVTPTPLALEAELKLKGFALADGGPYVPENVDAVVASGRLDATASADLVTRKDTLSGTFGGSAAIRSLKVLDRRRGDLLAWKALTIDGLKGSLAPMRVQVGKVSLAGLRADVVMDKDGNLKLPLRSTPPPASGNKAPPSKGPPAQAMDTLALDELLVSDGLVNFTDQGVPGDFHATVKDISARVTGLSTAPNMLADVRAQMTLPKGAPLRITGKAAPLRKQAYADLGLTLEKLDLSTATPYSGTYLGLEVDQGALTVKSRAKVERGKLAAENRVRVEQLKFGKAVKSDKATLLPVQLLIDILRDRNGDVVLDLPVAASTDDENVAGTIVMQVAKDVLLPPGSPLRNIAFEECSTGLDPDAQDRLRKLAAALQERPAMKIIAVGYVDREADGKACRDRVAVEKGASPPLDGDARMKQLAEGRAAATRDFLVVQGAVDPTRVSATTGDVYGAPRQKGDRQARVEFARATD